MDKTRQSSTLDWTAEDDYWRTNYKTRSYASGSTYDRWQPGYRYGWESAQRYQGKNWNDVEKDLRKEDPSANAARILLGRAALLSKVDKQQTLFALQQALQVINKLDRFDLKDPTAPRLGISISPRSESLADAPRVGFSFRSAIEAIVQDEFDDVAELASSFKVKEVRGIGRLEVARLFLEKTGPSRR